MPNKINWSQLDLLIEKHLPEMTCVDFCTIYASETIPRTIGQRAKKLGVKPAPAKISEEQREAIIRAASKFCPTPEIDVIIRSKHGKIGTNDIAALINWTPYAVRKRMVELGFSVPKVVSEVRQSVRVDSNRIDWSTYDFLLKQHLPNMTIRDFQRGYMSHVSEKAIGARAKALRVKSAPYSISEEHREKVAEGVREYVFTAEQDQFIRDNINRLGQAEIAKALSVSHMAIWRRMDELGLKRDSLSLSVVQ